MRDARHTFTKRKESPSKRKPQQEGDASSRVAPFSPPDDAQKRSTIDSHRSRHTRRRDDARARAFLPSRAPDRAPFSTSSLRPDTSSSLHPERERERESPKHREKNEKKKKRPRVGQLATFARRHNHLLSRVRTKTDEKTAVRALEKTRAARERERERKSHRVPFFRSYKQNVKTKVSSSPKQKKPKPCKVGLKFRVL